EMGRRFGDEHTASLPFRPWSHHSALPGSQRGAGEAVLHRASCARASRYVPRRAEGRPRRSHCADLRLLVSYLPAPRLGRPPQLDAHRAESLSVSETEGSIVFRARPGPVSEASSALAAVHLHQARDRGAPGGGGQAPALSWFPSPPRGVSSRRGASL